MALSNTERQRRYRERVRAALQNAQRAASAADLLLRLQHAHSDASLQVAIAISRDLLLRHENKEEVRAELHEWLARLEIPASEETLIALVAEGASRHAATQMELIANRIGRLPSSDGAASSGKKSTAKRTGDRAAADPGRNALQQRNTGA
jgi:type II secretory pathway component GspD/PulD (secretin)